MQLKFLMQKRQSGPGSSTLEYESLLKRLHDVCLAKLVLAINKSKSLSLQ